MGGSSASSPSLVDSLFQRSLDDLIKSLRSHPIAGEAGVLSKTLDEIRREIRFTDLETKSLALQKLTYLSSLYSVDMSWASFHALELLPSPSFLHKTIAYLAASLSFHPSTDVLLLITNQLRKDLTGTNDAVAGLALEFLAVAATPDLARDLTPEVYTLLASSKASVRKKSTTVVLRVFKEYPDSVRVAFKRLVENLECADQRVVSAAVGVFCELVASDPRSYLPLAPEFYRILVDCKNNWVLIKVLKIFARLVPLEPRLAKRVVDTVCEHMRRSMAKSLVFECIRTVLLSLVDHDHAVRLAVEKIREFLASEDDSNLRYLGLRALSMLGPRHPWAVEEREAVVKSLSDADPNIQWEALHLIMGMVTESNIVEVFELLVNHTLKSDPVFCNEILGSILSTCSRNYYELIADFDWYVSLLGEMARNAHCTKGQEIERQLVDIGLRVKDARPELVSVARGLLIDPALLGNHFLSRILSAAAWISGEFIEFSRNPWELVEALLQPRTNLLPPLVRAVYLQAVFKIVLFCLDSHVEQLEAGQSYSHGDLDSESQTPRNSGAVRSDVLANHQFNDEIMACKLDISSHEFDGGSQILEDPDIVANHQLNDESSGMASKDAIASHESASVSGSAVIKGSFTYESIERILTLIETAVGPLSECDEVEVQERARNVLGLIHALHEIRGCNFDVDLKEDAAITEMIRLLHDAFTEELGPVSANAQERVPIPDGLTLRDDLSEIATILGIDDAKPHFSSLSLSLQSHGDRKKEEEAAPSTDSNLLLSEHRKRHGLYYLPTEKTELENNDYPHVSDPGLTVNRVNSADATDSLLKLTDQSLVQKKTKQAKPRPTVVKLEEGEDVLESSRKIVEPKDDLLSGAIHDVLLDNKSELTSYGKKSADKSTRRRGKEDIDLNSASTSQQKENLGDTERGTSSTRRSRRQSHGKSKHRSSQENKNEEQKNKMNSSRSHHHGRQEHRRKGDGSVNVVPQTPVIQDFLL